MTARPHGDDPENAGDHRCKDTAQRHHEPRRHVQVEGEERRRVRPEPHERALAEGDVAGEAGDDVPAARHDREEEAEEEHSLPVEAVRVEGKDDEPGRAEDERGDVRAAAEDEPLVASDVHAVATSSRVREPKSPCGRSSRTAKITT